MKFGLVRAFVLLAGSIGVYAEEGAISHHHFTAVHLDAAN
jgi:hypothetical protein